MKCMDCVSVCPNDALSLGIGRPAIMVDAEEKATKAVSGAKYDLSWPEEIVFALLAVGLLFSIRGAYALPLLFASGVAACGTWIIWKAWRMLRDPNVSFHRMALRRDGRFQPGGIGFLVFAAVILGLSAWTGAANFAAQMAFRYDEKVMVPPSVVFTIGYVVPEADVAADAEASLKWYRRAAFIGDGGWSPIPAYREMFMVRKAWLQSVQGRFKIAIAELDDAIDRLGMNEDLAMARSRLLRMIEPTEVDAWYGMVLDEHPTWMRLRDERIMWRYEEMSARSAIDEARVGLAAMPNELLPMRRLAVLLVDHGSPSEIAESADLTEATLEVEPENANAWRALALARAKTGDFDRAELAMREAVRLAAEDWQLRYQFALLLNERQKRDLATIELAESIRLWEAAGGQAVGDRPTLPTSVPASAPTAPSRLRRLRRVRRWGLIVHPHPEAVLIAGSFFGMFR